MPKFNDYIDILIEHEGGYSNNPKDPGGETKYGISKRSYPHIDIKSLSKDEAKEIYRVDWWNCQNFDNFPFDSIAGKMFDISVNIGFHQSNKCLQRAIRCVSHANIDDDGIIGPITKTVLVKCDELSLLCSLKSEIAGYYRQIKDPAGSLNGWLNRAYS